VSERGPRTYITPEGARRLRQEFERLWRIERPRVTREVQAAAAHGDRSENAEYIYGKRRLREIDARLRYLSGRLESVVVFERREPDDGRVYFGAWVTLAEESGDRLRYRLVGPDESDVAAGRISVESPLGRVLLGREEGEHVVVQRPKGVATFTIVSVEYEPGDPGG
jgi:transcription elongation factor GreB